MKILITSHHVLPQMGGVELITDRFLEDLVAQGVEVDLVTQTPDPVARPGVRVHVQPRPVELWRLIRSADVVFQNQVSLNLGYPLLLTRTPLVVSMHNWMTDGKLKNRVLSVLKQLFLYRASTAFACSRALADSIWRPTTVAHPGYEEAVFHADTDRPPSRDIAFVGRLSTDKGIFDLMTAFGGLVEHHRPQATLTIIGDGWERADLEAEVERRGLAGQVRLLGQLSEADVAAQLRDHRCLVVPSRSPEPFGMVALEGLACGCTVITSNQGGLPEALGGLGLVFPNGDTGALEALMRQALRTSSDGVGEVGGVGGVEGVAGVERVDGVDLAERKGHLSLHTTRRLLDAYLQACVEATRRRR